MILEELFTAYNKLVGGQRIDTTQGQVIADVPSLLLPKFRLELCQQLFCAIIFSRFKVITPPHCGGVMTLEYFFSCISAQRCGHCR
jgi:hypothetical protein